MEERVVEEAGDLFELEHTHSLAHCVSEDLKMNKGIAKSFRSRYGKVEELREQNPRVGSVLFLQICDGNYAYYLITKRKYYQKPTYDSLRSCLEQLKECCILHSVHNLAIPRLGCGLDHLTWSQVSSILSEVFSSSPISIRVRYI